MRSVKPGLMAAGVGMAVNIVLAIIKKVTGIVGIVVHVEPALAAPARPPVRTETFSPGTNIAGRQQSTLV